MPLACPVEQHFVRLVPGLQRAVVEQTGFLQQRHRVEADRPRGSACPDRPAAGRLRDVIERARQQARFLDGVVQRHDVFVAPSEHADLVTLSLDDLRHHLRVDERRNRRDEECRRHVVLVEQGQHARQALRRAEFTAGHGHDGRVAACQLIRRVVHVERERDRHAGAVRPAPGVERAAGANVARRLAQLRLAELPARLVVGPRRRLLTRVHSRRQNEGRGGDEC